MELREKAWHPLPDELADAPSVRTPIDRADTLW